MPQFDLRLHQLFVAVAAFVVAAHALHAAHLGVHVPRGGSGRGVGVEVAGQHGPFPEFLVEVEGQREASERAARVAQPFGIPFGLGLDEDALRGVERHVARVVLGEKPDIGVEGVGLVTRRGDVIREGVLFRGVVAPLLPEAVKFAHLAARNRFPGFHVGSDVVHAADHVRIPVFGSGVVDAAADADVEAAHERGAVGDAESAHRRGEVLGVTLLAGVVTHAVEGAGEVDECARVAQPLFVVVVDVVARETQQHEFFGREVAVNRNVRRCGDRVGAVEPVEARQQKPDAEAHVRGVVGTRGDAPVDLLFESAVHVRAAVIVDDAADQPRPFHRSGEGCRIRQPDSAGVGVRFGLPDLRKRLFGRGEILLRGVRALGRRAQRGCRQQDGEEEETGLFHEFGDRSRRQR